MYRTVGPILVAWMALACTVWAQNPPGKEIFENRCGTCHGADGNGGEHAPTITRAAPDLQDPQLASAHEDLVAGLRHLAYSAGWKKFEPLWDLVIRARRAGTLLPVLETFLSEFGRRSPGSATRDDLPAADRRNP